MPIFHVETPNDFLFFIGQDRDTVIKYVRNKKLKINAINIVDQDLYNTLLKIEFIKEAEFIN